MTVREEVQRLLDEMPEQQLGAVREFIEDLRSPAEDDEPLSAETLAAIREGLDDIERGNTLAVRQYRRTRGL